MADMTKEEKDIFSKVKYFKWEHPDCTNSISGTNDPFYNTMRYPIYFDKNANQDLSTILANGYSSLSGVIAEYEINAGLRS